MLAAGYKGAYAVSAIIDYISLVTHYVCITCKTHGHTALCMDPRAVPSYINVILKIKTIHE